MALLGCRYIAKAMQTNPLIQQMIAEFWNTRAKYTWFVGSPFAVIIPLLAIAKSITFTALLQLFTSTLWRFVLTRSAGE